MQGAVLPPHDTEIRQITDEIRKAMVTNRMGQKELARLMSVSQSTICSYLNNIERMSVSKFLDMARILKVEVKVGMYKTGE